MKPRPGLAGAAAAIAGETLVEKIIADLYDAAKKAAGEKIKIWSIKKSSKKLFRHVHKIRLVKTLWQVDKAVDLKEFYCDSHFIVDKKRIVVSSINDFGDRKRVLITGIAGQGKSIFLRYLCSNALVTGHCVPIFIELRRVLPGESLVQHVRQFLEIIGISEVSDPVLKILLSSGRVVLFLDGFDEVAESDKPMLVREIEDLALIHDSLGMIVTSRPESGLEVSPLLEVIKMSDLRNGEYKVVVRKLSEDTSFADNLIKQVEVHRAKLEDLLCTPLLVTLLVMSYKSYQELPDQLSEFYDSIFQVLLQRHDGVKPGFKRIRRCPLNDHQYRTVFEGFCFEAKHNIVNIFSYEHVIQFTKAALVKSQLTVDADKYLEDITKVTCLVLRESKDYRFIHKSVQEYYAASFIRHRSEPVARKFYEQMVPRGPYSLWAQELRFLSEIDRYRYNRYFYMPYLCTILKCATDTLPEVAPRVDSEDAKTILGSIRIGFDLGASKLQVRSLVWNQNISVKNVEVLLHLDFSEVIVALRGGKVSDTPQDPTHIYRNPGKPVAEMSLSEMLDRGLMHGQLIPVAQGIVDDAFAQAKNASKVIASEENINIDITM